MDAIDCVFGQRCTKLLGNEGKLVRGPDLNAELAHPHDWAGLFALLFAPLRLALVLRHNGNTRVLGSVRHGKGILIQQQEQIF